jgi:hypothetical protein
LFVSENSGCTPNYNKVTLSQLVLKGSQQLTVQPLVAQLSQGEQISLYRSDRNELIGIAVTTAIADIGQTTVSVEPVDFEALSGDYGLYFGLNEIFGIESTPFQGSSQLNAITLMNSGGWVSNSVGISEWNFQLSGYVTSNAATGYRLIKKAFLTRTPLYIERHFLNGEVATGRVIPTTFSDQVQGSNYTQYSVTFEGSSAHTLNLLVPRLSSEIVATQPSGSEVNNLDYSSSNNSFLLAIV